MKTTTRLYDIIYSFYNNLYGDFVRDNQIVYFDTEMAFSHKVVKYDDEVKTVCRDTIFYGLDFLNSSVRAKFEQEFISRFISRTIKFQTYTNFNWKLVAYARGVSDIINQYYSSANKYLEAYSSSDSANNSKSSDETLSRTNSLSVSLPQDNTDLSLDKDTYDYADTTDHSKSKSASTTNQASTNTNTTTSYDVKALQELKEFHDNLFNDLDRLLFSQML